MPTFPGTAKLFSGARDVGRGSEEMFRALADKAGKAAGTAKDSLHKADGVAKAYIEKNGNSLRKAGHQLVKDRPVTVIGSAVAGTAVAGAAMAMANALAPREYSREFAR